jgi:2-hydroxymuconate-semialdehyde hydrolase
MTTTLAPVAITTTDVAVGDYSFHVSTSGDPSLPTIVFLHGSGPGVTALSNWEGTLGELGARYHCIAPDILGFGRSTHPVDPPQGIASFLELRATTTIGLFDALGLEKVSLVGNSMGGMLTLKLLGMIPDRIDKVVLMGSGGAPVPPTGDLIKLATYYNNPTEDAMTEMMTSFVYDPASFGDDLRKIAAARMPLTLDEGVRRSHVATFNFAAGGPVLFDAEFLGKIQQDVLIIHGRDDTVIPRDAGYYFLEHLPNADLHVIAHCGHWTQIEQPKRFRALVDAFMSEGM